MSYPFAADQIQNHRFHGLLQGKFTLVDNRLHLETAFGLVAVHKRPAKEAFRTFYAARRQQANHPDALINAYGYPRTNNDGKVDRLELCSWFVDGTPMPENFRGISRHFTPGQLFLCGRIRPRQENGLITTKVKTILPDGRKFVWFVNGRCVSELPPVGSKTLFLGWISPDGQLMLQVEKVITAAGQKTVPAPSKAADSSRPPAVADQPSARQSKSASAASARKRQPSPTVPRQQPAPAELPDRPEPLRRPQPVRRP